jgi:serpin B
MKLRVFPVLFVLVCVTLVSVGLTSIGRAAPPVQVNTGAVGAINALGIDLLRHSDQPGANTVFSPYSIQLALVMACAGADGQTRDEMVRALHYPKDEKELNLSFAALQTNVIGIMSREAALAQQEFQNLENNELRWVKHHGEDTNTASSFLSKFRMDLTNALPTLTTANRLYGQSGYDFRPDYLKLLKDNWQASFESVDFAHNSAGITAQINSWVQDQTHDRIKDLIPAGALGELSKLVLVNVIYLKAPWSNGFLADRTKPEPFNLSDGTVIQVPTMYMDSEPELFPVGYSRRGGDFDPQGHGYTIVSLPYKCRDLQFVILVPDSYSGLPALESSLTPELLAECANLPTEHEVDLSLPKFKLDPPAFPLAKTLQDLGMKNAFEDNANFNRALLHPEKGLFLTGVFHKTFLQVDETGTEASAGTGVAMVMAGIDTNVPIQVHIDRPFLFMIQHRPTGACLFLGRVTDPR